MRRSRVRVAQGPQMLGRHPRLPLAARDSLSHAAASLVARTLIAHLASRSSDRLPPRLVDEIELRRIADQGDADALYALEHCHYHGKHLPQDYAKAAALFSRAAE
ncbi:hypothetical protein T492DRAFT_887595 [Pavlovales sp. CCMP2436]|nr:hypothetical protein T492DRAFT_887595 [Pavlovales sp. CCMP2436]